MSILNIKQLSYVCVATIALATAMPMHANASGTDTSSVKVLFKFSG